MTSRRSAERTIVHVDMDAFFVAVEVLAAPELRGRPVVVGGTGSRGVVASASYEARARGVRSAMPTAQARRLCPEAVFLAGRHSAYAEVSQRLMGVLGAFSPLVEPVSLDEAFLDLSNSRAHRSDPAAAAQSIRQAVLEAEGLACSVGVAPNKFLAKLASEVAKPTPDRRGPQPGPGVVVVTDSEVISFLHPLEVSALWGVGPVTLGRLGNLGVRTVGDLARLPLGALTSALGKAAGEHLHALAHGIDDRAVQAHREARSVGHEQTYPADLHSRREVDRELLRLCDAVAARLRSAGLRCKTVTVKVRFGDFSTITRSSSWADGLDTAAGLARAARSLAATVDISAGVRLLGVSAGGLRSDSEARQLSFEELAGDPRRRAEQAVDAIRQRWGSDSIGPGALTESAPKPGADRWGPQG